MDIIVADDDKNLRLVLQTALEQWQYNVIACANIEELLEVVAKGSGHVLLSDVLMPDGNGLNILPHIKKMRPNLPIIIMSARIDLLTAIQAEHEGAFAFLPKPFDLDKLHQYIESCLQESLFNPDNSQHNMPDGATAFAQTHTIIGQSPAMANVFKRIARLTHTDLSVIIFGESGTGKELIAKALHDYSARAKKPFIALNMASLPKNLIESELFGHEKGSFTGAHQQKHGKFYEAEGGTLFLDEIGDMPKDAQTRLLRVLQEGEYSPIGSNKVIKTDIRIIAATHHHLKQAVQNNDFRADLFFRLHGAMIEVPPLRERLSDIALLVAFFNQKASLKKLSSKKYNKKAITMLQHHTWPGNVRELENFIYRMNALTPGLYVNETDIEEELNAIAAYNMHNHETSFYDIIMQHMQQEELPSTQFYQQLYSDIDKAIMQHALSFCQNNKAKTAEILGINRNTLMKKYKQYMA